MDARAVPLGQDGNVRFSVAIVEPDNRARSRLLRLLKDALAVDPFPSIDAMEAKVDLTTPWIVMLGPSYADDTGLKEIQVLARHHPEVAAVLVVEDLSTEILQLALRAGVRDVVSRPRDGTELLEAVERVAETLGGTPMAAARGPGEDRGRLTVIVSTKGGAGKSVVATNVAVALARLAGDPVALVDADLQFGDVAIMLGLAPTHTIVDVMSVIRRLDAPVLRELLVRHEASGLLVLPAPIEPAFADQVGAADMVRIVNVLQSFCAHVVVDTSPQLNDLALALLEESDDILLVCPLEVPSIKNAKLALQTLRLLNIPLSKVKLLLNRAPSKARLELREAEQALQMEADATMPSDGAVPKSVNAGIPVVLSAPRSSAAKTIQSVARMLARDRH
jgi:pilus assembly protein CpaE